MLKQINKYAGSVINCIYILAGSVGRYDTLRALAGVCGAPMQVVPEGSGENCVPGAGPSQLKSRFRNGGNGQGPLETSPPLSQPWRTVSSSLLVGLGSNLG